MALLGIVALTMGIADVVFYPMGIGVQRGKVGIVFYFIGFSLADSEKSFDKI
jgi:hypothetical protein